MISQKFDRTNVVLLRKNAEEYQLFKFKENGILRKGLEQKDFEHKLNNTGQLFL